MGRNTSIIYQYAYSALCLVMLYVGSTTIQGCLVGLTGQLIGVCIIYDKKLWGFIPGAIATTCVFVFNLWRAS